MEVPRRLRRTIACSLRESGRRTASWSARLMRLVLPSLEFELQIDDLHLRELEQADCRDVGSRPSGLTRSGREIRR